MSKFEIIGRPLTLNGRCRKVGAKVEVSDQDAFVLIRAGRLRTYEEQPKAPAKPAGPKRRRRTRAKAPAGG
jgi:hypothetical protein